MQLACLPGGWPGHNAPTRRGVVGSRQHVEPALAELTYLPGGVTKKSATRRAVQVGEIGRGVCSRPSWSVHPMCRVTRTVSRDQVAVDQGVGVPRLSRADTSSTYNRGSGRSMY